MRGAGDVRGVVGAEEHDELADLGWQAELWRRLRMLVGTPSPAERLDAACAALRADPGRSDLPRRVSVFGPTRLTTDQVAVLGALAEHRDVHLWLPHPSATLWDRVAAAPVAVSGSAALVLASRSQTSYPSATSSSTSDVSSVSSVKIAVEVPRP